VNPTPAELEQVEAAKRAGYVVVAERPDVVLLKRPGARDPLPNRRNLERATTPARPGSQIATPY
jgi:hypothetical protein